MKNRIIISLMVIICMSCREHPVLSTSVQCVQPLIAQIFIYKEADSLLESTENERNLRFHNVYAEIVNQIRPDSLLIRYRYDSMERAARAYDDSLFNLIATKYRITDKCLDSIWWEGAQGNWHMMEIEKIK